MNPIRVKNDFALQLAAQGLKAKMRGDQKEQADANKCNSLRNRLNRNNL